MAAMNTIRHNSVFSTEFCFVMSLCTGPVDQLSAFERTSNYSHRTLLLFARCQHCTAGDFSDEFDFNRPV